MRLKARRDANEPAIIETLEACGWQVTRLSQPDVPDLLIAKAGRVLLVEVKTEKGALKPGQEAWIARWQGPPVRIVRSVEDALQVR